MENRDTVAVMIEPTIKQDAADIVKYIASAHLKVMYHNPHLTELSKSDTGNFIDLRSSKRYDIKKGDFLMIDLGISAEVENGFWVEIVPRSSLFKNHGLIQTNSVGVIDTSYCGEDDVWMMPVYATRDTVIDFNERVCQFRVVPDIYVDIETVDHLNNDSRGGFGSTGRQ